MYCLAVPLTDPVTVVQMSDSGVVVEDFTRNPAQGGVK